MFEASICVNSRLRAGIGRWIVLAGLAGVIALVASDCSNEAQPLPRMTVYFDVEVDGQPVELDSIQYVNAAGNHYSVDRLQFYLSDLFFFVDPAGTGKAANFLAPLAHIPWYRLDYHFRDLLDPATGRVVIDNFPNGRYHGLFFTLGFDDTLNVPATLPAMPPHTGMTWPEEYGGGYTFMKCEGRVDTGLDKSASGGIRSAWTDYEVHTGRLLLGGSRYGAAQDFTTIHTFDAFPGEEWETRIVMDLNQWFAGTTPYNLLLSPGPIEGDSVAQAALHEQAVQTMRVEIRRLR